MINVNIKKGMKAMNVRKYIKNNILLFDGAMGTMLQDKGLKIGENSEVFGYKNPEKLMEIHRLYLEAGSNIITTNTFGANELKLNKLGYTVEEIVDNAVSMAKKSIEKSDKSKPRFSFRYRTYRRNDGTYGHNEFL